MKKHYLHKLFEPRSVAVIGASERLDAVGGRVFHNIIEDGFLGDLYPVNPRREEIQGHRCWPRVSAIGRAVDLAILAIPAASVAEALRDCAESGVGAAIVMSAGFGEIGSAGAGLQAELVDIARTHDLPLLGPNSLGVLRPAWHFNASFAKSRTARGRVALLAQSVGFCNALLDWADSNGFGFSLMASPGAAADVDFGDLLDFLSIDSETQSVLVYVERIGDARAFLSGLRMVARVKPVIVLKSGRYAQDGSTNGDFDFSDRVFDAVVGRAGAVRVNTVHQLFTAARTLLAGTRVSGQRLAVIGNAGGPGRMAADRARRRAVELAAPSAATVASLRAFMPRHWQPANPFDLLGDAGPERYGEACRALLADAAIDGLLVLLTPQGMTDPLACAQAVVAATAGTRKPVIACWMGQNQVEASRALLAEADLPHYSSPERGVDAFAYLAAYRRNQEVLLQVPPPLSQERAPDLTGARLMIENALAERRNALTTTEAKAVLRAFHVPVTQSINATTPADALVAAETLGLPVAMKVNSADIAHKSEVGGVRLRVRDAHDVRTAYRDIMERVRMARPDARIDGVSVEPLQENDNPRELAIALRQDDAFGPYICLGAARHGLSLLPEPQVALPPLNPFLCRELIRRSIAGDGGEACGEEEETALASALMRVSEMACELSEIDELDLNPVRLGPEGVLALDARLTVRPRRTSTRRYGHMAIHPYPVELEQEWQLADGSDVLVRPIRPEDAELERAFVEALSPESRYYRFMYRVDRLSPSMLARFTQIDYDRELALTVIADAGSTTARFLGVARYIANPDGQSCEFALAIADEAQRQGFGRRLMEALMKAARDRGLEIMEGEVLTQNRKMLRLCEGLGFRLVYNREEGDVVAVRRHL